MNCEECPIKDECGLAEEKSKVCPLVALIEEQRAKILLKMMGVKVVE